MGPQILGKDRSYNKLMNYIIIDIVLVCIYPVYLLEKKLNARLLLSFHGENVNIPFVGYLFIPKAGFSHVSPEY